MNHSPDPIPRAAARPHSTLMQLRNGTVWQARHGHGGADWYRVWAESPAATRRRRLTGVVVIVLSGLYIVLACWLLLPHLPVPDAPALPLTVQETLLWAVRSAVRDLVVVWLPPAVAAAGMWLWSSRVVPSDRVPA